MNRNQIAFIFNSQLKENEIEARNLVNSLDINDRAWICSAAELVDKSDALDFFNSGDCDYDTYAEIEDDVDGEETEQAWVVGPSAKWVNYISPSGEYEEKS